MGLNLEYQKGQTPLEESERAGLKIHHITTLAELDEYEQLNIEEAVKWVVGKSFSKEKILTEEFIRSLHKRMFGDVWKWAGNFRASEKNIGADWVNIPIELKYLLDNTEYWIEQNTYEPDEIAIRFKHELVKIHCFPNGNGRHSRIMADLVAQHIFKREIFTWHSKKLKAPDVMRKDYITALREADRQNIELLIRFARS